MGYLKLTCSNSIFPFIVGSVIPTLLLESILGLLSRIPNMEAAESLALLVSGAMALAWETPVAAIAKAKKTWQGKKFTKRVLYKIIRKRLRI